MAQTVNPCFPPLKMLAFNRAAQQWASRSRQSPKPLHNSEPEPLQADEYEHIVGLSASTIIKTASLGYAPDIGTEPLRSALADSMPGLKPEDIISTAGAQEALTLVLHTLVSTGDKTVIITPVFEPILRLLEGIKAEIHCVPLQMANGQWQLDLERLFAAMGKNCTALVINLPHNPTGHVLPSAHWQVIVQYCEANGTWLVSDEVFRGLEITGTNRLSAAATVYPKGISIGVTAKSLALPGIRVGWMACTNRAFRRQVTALKQYFSICNSQLDETVATAAIKHAGPIWRRCTAIVERNSRIFQQTLNATFDNREEIKPIFVPPRGGNTGFVVLHGPNESTEQNSGTRFCRHLLQTTGLLCYPEQLFDSPLAGFRLGFGYRRFADEYAPLCQTLLEWLENERSTPA